MQDDDTIVDFCCGANDFSWLTKTKLDEIGKKCSYRNYDILQSKNDFNFEKRDWMNVKTDELPDGSRLIMGLNPPFGVNASLANKFIDKALEFKPKLLILIVPKETERLDTEKKMLYDLIWEDNELLAGKSFYLPGLLTQKTTKWKIKITVHHHCTSGVVLIGLLNTWPLLKSMVTCPHYGKIVRTARKITTNHRPVIHHRRIAILLT